MASSTDEILVDARWLEPPEPMEKVLQTLALLRPGQSIRMLLHREPFPLYSLLAKSGYRHTRQVAFGLLGWVLLLVIGVAYVVVPMFKITPPYPPRLSRWLTGALFALLLWVNLIAATRRYVRHGGRLIKP